MKKDSPTTLILVALLVAAVAYWYFFTGNSSGEATITSETNTSQAQTQFQSLMGALPTSFETGIFEDPRFSALVDISVAVTPESAGRLDPFAPFGAAQAAPH